MIVENFKILTRPENVPEIIRAIVPTCTDAEREAVLDDIGRTMRYADRREMKQWTGNGPDYEIRAAVKESEVTFVGYTRNGEPFSIFGGKHQNLMTAEGVIWELSSERVNENKLYFAKQSKVGMDLVMRTLHDVQEFQNYVSEEYESSIKWIEWLGGTMSCTKRFRGRCGGVFRLFYIENPYYLEVQPCA